MFNKNVLIVSTFFILGLILCSSCCKNSSIIEKNKHAENNILSVLKNQQDAWNKGNLDQFMEGYLHSEELTFIGKSGVNYGWKTTLANYKKGYPTDEKMGQLTFEVLSLEALSNNVYYMIGKYSLQRKNDNPQGYFSLVWKRVNGQWLIISDHTSG